MVREEKSETLSIRLTKEEKAQVVEKSRVYGSLTLYVENLLKKDGINIKTRTNSD